MMGEWFSKHWMVIALFVVCLYAMNQFAANQNRDEIVRVNVERETARAEAQALRDKEVEWTRERQQLQNDLKGKDAEIAQNQRDIQRLEREKDANRLQIRDIDTNDALLARFVETYPEVKKAKGFGMVDIVGRSGVPISYLSMPTFFVETFLIEHDSLGNITEQLDEYQANEELYGEARVLSAKLAHLENRRATAYKDGYNECNIRYQATIDRYITQLEKPRFELPGGAAMLGCAALGLGGIYIGSQF